MMNPRSPYASMLQQQMGQQPSQAQPAPMGSGRVPMQQLQRPMPQQPQAQAKPAGGGGMLGGIMGGLSDEHSKKEIARLSSANDALTKALSGSSGAPSGSMGTEEYPSMPKDTRFHPPSHASFDDGPANRVAAQNVGLSPEQPLPPPAQQPPARPGFDPRRPEFDMSALDEAYRRSGTTSGT